MKLHPSVVTKLLDLYANFGGFQNETKLRDQLENLDFTPYERKTTAAQETIIVLTEDYLKELQKRK
jgi:hypothetical protein